VKMTADDGAGLFADDKFASLDSFEDENKNRHNAIPKYKKKNDFNFTSLWRKPKLGRRKTKGDGRGQVTYDGSSDNGSSRTPRLGKYFKDRESFETAGSVPLSDFDEAKDTLPFLNFRTGFSNREEEGNSIQSNNSRVLKERTLLNPKMFLTGTPTKANDANRKVKSDHLVSGKSSKAETCDTFSNFDAFQNLSKEPSKPNVETEDRTNEKEGEPPDVSEKENFCQDTVYGADLYHDHGPILSSLSEDTLLSDSIRGERFLEDNFNDIDPSNNWNISRNDNTERERSGWNFFASKSQTEENDDTTSSEVNEADQIETSVRSFSDRLKLFQSKANQPEETLTSGLNKQPSWIPPTNRCTSTEVPHQDELSENRERLSSASISEIEIPAPNLEAESLIESDISEIDENNMNGHKKESICQKFNEEPKPSNIHGDTLDSKTEVRRNEDNDLQTCDSSHVKADSVEMEESSRSDFLQNTSDVSSLTMFSNSNANQYASKFGVVLSKRRDSKSRTENGKPNDLEGGISSVMRSSTRNEVEGQTIKATNDRIEGQTIKATTNDRIQPISGLEECTDSFEKTSVGSPTEKSVPEECFDPTATKSENEISSITDKPVLSKSNNHTSSFAQQSASIFGVKLSKSRNWKTKAPQNKQVVCQMNDNTAVAGEIEEMGCTRSSLCNPETQRKIACGLDEGGKNGNENGNENKNEEGNVTDGEYYKQSRKSTSSNATNGRTVNDFCEPKQDPQIIPLEPYQSHEQVHRAPTLATESIQIDESNNGDNGKGPISVDREVEIVSSREKRKKSSTLAARMKMFERVGISNNNSNNKDIKDVDDVVCVKSPGTNEERRSSSIGERTVVAKRKIVTDQIESGKVEAQSPSRKSMTSLNSPDEDRNNHHVDDDDGELVNDRRGTLQSVAKGVRSGSGILDLNCDAFPNQVGKSDESVCDEKENDSQDGDDILDNARKIEQSENHIHGGLQNRKSVQAYSPVRAAARKKFFEKLERSRVGSSMSRPLFEKKQTIIDDMTRIKKKEIDSLQDGSPNNGDGLPMFVTVEEDFLLKDNISTCLSASENRSVVCKPDKLLYSVSKKAMALMATKTEKVPKVSLSTTPKIADKETSQSESENKRTSIGSCDRLKVSSESGANTIIESQGGNNHENHRSIEHREPIKMRTSTISQRYNRFATKSNTSPEFSGDPNTKNEVLASCDIKEENELKIQPSVENSEANRMRTSSHIPNRFPRRIVSSEVSHEDFIEKSNTGENVQGNSDSNEKHLTPNQASNEKLKVAPLHRFKYNRFTRNDVALDLTSEEKGAVNATAAIQDGYAEKSEVLDEYPNLNTSSKMAPTHRFNFNRLTRKSDTLDMPDEAEMEQDSRLKNQTDNNIPIEDEKDAEVVVENGQNKGYLQASNLLKNNRFARKDIALKTRELQQDREDTNSKDNDKDVEPAVENQEPLDIGKPTCSNSFKYNRFTRKDSNNGGKNKEENGAKPTVEDQAPREITKQAPNRFKYNRFVQNDDQASKLKKEADANDQGENNTEKVAVPAIQRQEPKKATKPTPNRFKYNRFVQKDEEASKLKNETDASNQGESNGEKLSEPAIEKQEQTQMDKTAPNRFKYRSFAKSMTVKMDNNDEPNGEQASHLDSLSDNNEDAKDKINGADALLEQEKRDEDRPPPNRLKYNRFTRNDVARIKRDVSQREEAPMSEVNTTSSAGVHGRCEDKSRPSIENEERHEKAPSHRFQHNRFTRKDEICDPYVESKREQAPKPDEKLDDTTGDIESKSRIEMDEPLSTQPGKYSQFTKKKVSSNSRVSNSRGVEAGDNQDDVPVASSSSNENNEPLKNDKTSVEPQETHSNVNDKVPSASSQQSIPSRSIRERRMFFESQMKNRK